MRNKIATDISICQAENGFSLDELVKKLADAFENKAFAGILKMNLQLTQDILMHRIFNNSSNQKYCPEGHLTLNGSFERYQTKSNELEKLVIEVLRRKKEI